MLKNKLFGLQFYNIFLLRKTYQFKFNLLNEQ